MENETKTSETTEEDKSDIEKDITDEQTGETPVEEEKEVKEENIVIGSKEAKDGKGITKLIFQNSFNKD